jgi:hypothetical protein
LRRAVQRNAAAEPARAKSIVDQGRHPRHGTKAISDA